jgi:hypothetical protein
LLPDHICRQETLDEDLACVAAGWGLHYSGPRPRQKAVVHEHYSRYYSPALRSRVERLWARELWMFGYSFGGRDDSRAQLPRSISAKEKLRWSYDIRRDVLRHDGTEVTRERARL